MAATVYFATTRRVTDPEDWFTYGTSMTAAPSDPAAVTYGAARPLDASHQYYRRSAKVRADIAAVMAGRAVPGGVCAL